MVVANPDLAGDQYNWSAKETPFQSAALEADLTAEQQAQKT